MLKMHFKQLIMAHRARRLLWHFSQKETEGHVFLRRNKVHLSITIICLMLCLKQCQAPFFWKYNLVTDFLFHRLSNETVLGAIFETLYNIGFAYFVSFLFYLIVDYFPKREKERRAFLLTIDHLEQIDSLINRLFSFLLFVTGKGACAEDVPPETLQGLCNISLRDNDRYCHTKDINLQSSEVEYEGHPDCLNEIDYVREICIAILAQINTIMSQPYVANLETNLLEILTVLKENRMISGYARMPNKKNLNNKPYINNYSVFDINEAVTTLAFLRRYNYPSHKFITVAATAEEIEKSKKELQDFEKCYPESFALLNSIQNSINPD